MKERCRLALERAYLFLDGEVLTDEERSEILVHLEDCPPCYQRFGVEKEVTIMVARLRGHTSCPDKVRSKILSLFED